MTTNTSAHPLAHLLRARQLTVAEVCRRAKMRTSAYHALRHAKRGPRSDRIAALAHAIGCDAADIVSAWAA